MRRRCCTPDLTDEGPPRKAVDIANILWPGAEWSSYMHPLATKFPGSDSNVVMKVRDATSARAAGTREYREDLEAVARNHRQVLAQ